MGTDDRQNRWPLTQILSMDRRGWMIGAGGILAAAGLGQGSAWAGIGADESVDDLARRFDNPPAEAGLGAYWYWLAGAVTREGITADLESMQANGITTAMMFAIGASGKAPLVSPPADALTQTWWAMIDHAVAEADRLGMTLSLNICDGWATASGPWITPDRSMQVLTWSEGRMSGGQGGLALPEPPRRRDYYRDVAAYAFPWPEDFDATSAALRPHVSTSLPLKGAAVERLIDPANKDEIFDTVEGGHIDMTFAAPFTLRSVTVRTPSPWGYSPGVYRAANTMEVQASDDGVHFRPVGFLEYPQHGWQTDLTTLTHALPETTARVFRFIHRPLDPGDYRENYDFAQDVRLRLFSLELQSCPQLHQIAAKTGAQWGISRRTSQRDIPDAACVDPARIIDVSAHMRVDGRLDWTAPPGRWRILRMGVTTNGRENSAAGGAQGLEVDRFDKEAVTMQFDRWFGDALKRIGPARAGRVLTTVHVDSWEASGQNWSAQFPQQFRKLRNYDLMAWLPVMAGVPIATAQTSEAVLHDVRETIADLTQSEFFDTVGFLAHRHGCRFSGEPASPTYAVDGLRWARATDVPMGEFWLRTPRNDKPTDVADAVSGGHIYGKRIIATESFTENDILWDEHPAMLKPLGDRHYCRGVNRFMLHVYVAQPFLDRAPGMTLNGIGSMFGRTQTWWREGLGWFTYMRRVQAVLQAGRPVADIAVFIGEEIPSRALLPDQLPLPIPPGWTYDSINADALLGRSLVLGGVINLPGGAAYRLLLLPNQWRASSAFLEGLAQLIAQGARVHGPAPLGPVGREADPARFDRAVRALWGPESQALGRGANSIGKGRLTWGDHGDGALLFAALGAPDLLCDVPGALDWTHRAMEQGDAYFIVNTRPDPLATTVTIRAQDHAGPELWNPVDGRRLRAPVWRRQSGRLAVDLALEGYESVLLILRRGGVRAHVEQVLAADPGLRLIAAENGAQILAQQGGAARLRMSGGQSVKRTMPQPPPPMVLDGPWHLSFAGHRAAPPPRDLARVMLWSDLDDPAARHHSGQGRYQTRIVLPPHRLGPGQVVMLDLGVVREMARVIVNGQQAGTVWIAPFRMDVTRWLRPGANEIEVIVTNTWHNRLVADAALPQDQRVTWVFPQMRGKREWLPKADAALIPSGLAGPVRLIWARAARVSA